MGLWGGCDKFSEVFNFLVVGFMFLEYMLYFCLMLYIVGRLGFCLIFIIWGMGFMDRILGLIFFIFDIVVELFLYNVERRVFLLFLVLDCLGLGVFL